MTILGKQFKS